MKKIQRSVEKSISIIIGINKMKRFFSFFTFLLLSFSISAQILNREDSLFTSEAFSFKVKGGLDLTGIITIPDSMTMNSRIAILVSPPQRADKEYIGMFTSLAKTLGQQGIVTLRFDNRSFTDTTLIVADDVVTMFNHADDLQAALKAIRMDKRFSNNPIGLIGHSEGGSSAIIEAARNKDVAFLITLSTCGLTGAEFVYWQSTLFLSYPSRLPAKQRNVVVKDIYEKIQIIKTTNSYSKTKNALIEQTKQNAIRNSLTLSDVEVENNVSRWIKPRLLAFMKYNPELYLSKIVCPVLAVHGMMDGMLDWKVNLDGIEKSFIKSGKTNYEMIALEKTDHSYQPANSTMPFFISIQHVPNWKPSYSEGNWNKLAAWISKLNFNE